MVSYLKNFRNNIPGREKQCGSCLGLEVSTFIWDLPAKQPIHFKPNLAELAPLFSTQANPKGLPQLSFFDHDTKGVYTCTLHNKQLYQCTDKLVYCVHLKVSNNIKATRTCLDQLIKIFMALLCSILFQNAITVFSTLQL